MAHYMCLDFQFISTSHQARIFSHAHDRACLVDGFGGSIATIFSTCEYFEYFPEDIKTFLKTGNLIRIDFERLDNKSSKSYFSTVIG